MFRRVVFLPLKVLPFEIVLLGLGFFLAPLIGAMFSPMYWPLLLRAVGLG